MKDFTLSNEDRRQLEDRGITKAQIIGQMKKFRKPSFFLHLNRPCTPGDGIRRISPEETEKYLKLHQEAAAAGRFLKFVPASGAATRMFQALFQIYQSYPEDLEEICPGPDSGDDAARAVPLLGERIKSLALYEDLTAVMALDDFSPDLLIRQQKIKLVVEYLLKDKGLNYGYLPKALLKFHRYASGTRTAYEEHLHEAAHYILDQNQVCRLHFTISMEHEEDFRKHARIVHPICAAQCGAGYEIGFSPQKPSTDTIAVDRDNLPFRDDDGRLIFRPGGHGALLENLNDLRGDLVYIKNIDNVAPDHLKGPTFLWKKILGGYLVELQDLIHGYVRKLRQESPTNLHEEIEDFAEQRLFIDFPEVYEGWSSHDQRRFLLEKLTRPIRVCGMVPNVGEPGGGPFWVEGKSGTRSLQIVEKAQVDAGTPEQKAIWDSSTHFNPVDLVCSLRDDTGKPFNLHRYVDQEAFFISRKSLHGKILKALELPGLWNGSMSDWITVFVEVPGATFTPVKTIDDLLRPEHQPPGEA